jgi:valyl-tRNA synthetase
MDIASLCKAICDTYYAACKKEDLADDVTLSVVDLSRADALVTAYDIIFFWVSRMIMAGLEFTGKAPFRDICLHGLVRDKQGRKMSKSLGNGLDPLELVDEFGADAMKFTLAFMCAQGQDVLIDKESFKMGSKFANKVWNASRYILMNLEGRNLIDKTALLPVDKWIYSRLNSAARAMDAAFLSYRFNDAAQTAYEYFWNDFCDWYVEATKISIKSDSADNAEKDRAATVLLDVLRESLRLLHPLLPFVTEEIYGKLPNVPDGELLITSPYPQYSENRYNESEEKRFAFLQELVRIVRTLRAECAIAPDKKLKVAVCPAAEYEQTFTQNQQLVQYLAGIGEIDILPDTDGRRPAGAGRPAGAIALVGSGFEVFVFIADAVDTGALKQKFGKELERDQKYIQTLRSKLANEQFLKNAPPELVAAEHVKLEESIKRTEKLESYLRDL